MQFIQIHEEYSCLSPQGMQNILSIKIPAPNQRQNIILRSNDAHYINIVDYRN